MEPTLQSSPSSPPPPPSPPSFPSRLTPSIHHSVPLVKPLKRVVVYIVALANLLRLLSNPQANNRFTPTRSSSTIPQRGTLAFCLSPPLRPGLYSSSGGHIFTCTRSVSLLTAGSRLTPTANLVKGTSSFGTGGWVDRFLSRSCLNNPCLSPCLQLPLQIAGEVAVTLPGS
ncbi:hypothetical protein LY78DRAFT_470100 [Colletotrichum sublineola]|nr:hypothetical protein LY78DRAFT_470100 [Colletotrichum sublineola]